jgi:hypothetical protein
MPADANVRGAEVKPIVGLALAPSLPFCRAGACAMPGGGQAGPLAHHRPASPMGHPIPQTPAPTPPRLPSTLRHPRREPRHAASGSPTSRSPRPPGSRPPRPAPNVVPYGTKFVQATVVEPPVCFVGSRPAPAMDRRPLRLIELAKSATRATLMGGLLVDDGNVSRLLTLFPPTISSPCIFNWSNPRSTGPK